MDTEVPKSLPNSAHVVLVCAEFGRYFGSSFDEEFFVVVPSVVQRVCKHPDGLGTSRVKCCA